MNYEQAVELATLAHKGQWRRPKIVPNSRLPKSILEVLTTNPYNFHGLLYSLDKESNLLEQEPYITHPIAVANMFDDEESKIIAVLHDIIEDTSAELLEEFDTIIDDYRQYIVFNETKYEIGTILYIQLDLLTHRENESYTEYITRITSHFGISKSVVKIKLADIYHNSLTATPKQQAKYMKALPILLKTL